MINITDKAKCCGCTACKYICPNNCIRLDEDEEGFLYPKIDTARCINCGLCEKVCPMLNTRSELLPLGTYAAINEDENIRKKSSSGGVFSLLAEWTIGSGGVVYGARYNSDWMVITDSIDSLEEIYLFRGSKYMQSNLNDSYLECREILKEGRLVLFCGTPCQISGLKNYLRCQYDNLITVDFVCHGVPSPRVWRRYLEELFPREGDRVISDINFRDKKNGWKQFRLVIDYIEDGQRNSTASVYTENIFMRAFLSDLILRPSCYQCPVKCGRSHADITIGDLWGAEYIVPYMDDNQGISLVMTNTSKGEELFKKIPVKEFPIEYIDVCKYNSAIVEASRPHLRRSEFFKGLEQTKSISESIKYSLRPTFRQRLSLIRQFIRSLIVVDNKS